MLPQTWIVAPTRGLLPPRDESIFEWLHSKWLRFVFFLCDFHQLQSEIMNKSNELWRETNVQESLQEKLDSTLKEMEKKVSESTDLRISVKYLKRNIEKLTKIRHEQWVG